MWRPLFWWHPSNTFSKKTSEAPWTFFKNIKNHLKHHEPFSRTLKIIFNIAQIAGVRSSVNIHNASSLGRHPKYEVAVLIAVTILAAILPEGVHLGGHFFWIFLISLLLGNQNILEILSLQNYQWPFAKRKGSLTIFMSASSLDQSRFRLAPGQNSQELPKSIVTKIESIFWRPG